jgi:predicted transcriptional regulator
LFGGGEDIMLSNRRSSIEVVADMLRLGEAGKTEIMYSANMSYAQLQKYLKFLLELKLIDKMTVGNPIVTYRITEKGLRLLRSIDNILETLEWKKKEDEF